MLTIALWKQSSISIEAEPMTTPIASIVVNAPSRQELTDGSIVELRAGAELRVAFTDEVRRVILEHGEAHFDVAKNPARPFVVQAGGIEVRAVGTAFAVEVGEKEVAVVVTEGRVALDSPVDRGVVVPRVASEPNFALPPAARPLAFVDAGGRAVIGTKDSGRDPSAHVEAVTTAEISARLAWRETTLELSGTPLSEAIPMFNRHGRVRLVLEDARLGRIRLSGVLRTNNVDTLLRLLEEEHGIVARRGRGDEIVLAKRR
jgi:transmembrane sensor